MVARFWTSLILKLACAATVAWLVALMYEKGFRPVRDVVDMFRRLPKVSRVLLGAFFVGMWLFASIKPDGDGNGERRRRRHEQRSDGDWPRRRIGKWCQCGSVANNQYQCPIGGKFPVGKWQH